MRYWIWAGALHTPARLADTVLVPGYPVGQTMTARRYWRLALPLARKVHEKLMQDAEFGQYVKDYYLQP